MDEPAIRTESLLKLTWPIYLQQTTHTVVFLVDFWFFSHLSDRIAGTVGQLLPIFWLGAFVIPVFAGTGVAVASQYMGAKKFEKVVPVYMMNLCLTGSMGFVFAALLWLFSPDIGRWMGMDAALNAIATAYLGTISAYFVFMGILVSYAAVLSSRGMTHWLMYVAVTVASLNVALASLFVLVLHRGVRGVVLASVISVAIATCLAVWLVHFRLKVRFYARNAVADMLGVLRPMLRIGVSNALEPFSYCVQQIIVSAMIIALGVVSMAANSYSSRAQMLQITFSVSLALGCQILMGHWMGARRFDDVDRLFWKAIKRGTCVACAYALLVWMLSDLALGVFTHDPAVLRLGKTLLLVSVFLEPARAVNIIAGFTLKTVGDARFPLVVAIVFIWGILPVVIFINHTWGMGLLGFWICFAADEIIRAGINLWRWRTGRWRTMGITEAGATASAALGDAIIIEP
jgi:putative MATE family efflux protein